MEWISLNPEILLVLTIVFAVLLVVALSVVLYEKRVGSVLRRQFEQSRAQYEQESKRKNEFVSFATHQLRTPLTAISWGIDTLLDDKDRFSNSDVAILEKLRITSKDLVETVNDLLDVSLIEQGGLVLKKQQFDIGVLVGTVTETLRPLSEKKGLALLCRIECPGAIVSGDKVKLRQVVANIIENAIKYTESGSIAISVSCKDGKVCISVRDTGRGISADDIKKLFHKFERGSMRASEHSGSGLGLYLSKQIVELHGGTITLSSPGVTFGTTATVVFPVSRK